MLPSALLDSVRPVIVQTSPSNSSRRHRALARSVALWWCEPLGEHVLWAIAVGLSITILAYHIEFRLELVPRLPQEGISRFQIFGLLLYAWAIAQSLLLFRLGEARGGKWKGLGIAILALLVLRGFWIKIAAIQHQSLLHAGETASWLKAAHIIRPGPYSDWPGLSVTTVVLSRVADLKLFAAIDVLTWAMSIAVVVAGYTFLLRALGSCRYATLGCLMIVLGDQWLHFIYFPWIMGLTLMLTFLIVLFREPLVDKTNLTVGLLLFCSSILAHSFGAVLMWVMLASTVAFGLLLGSRSRFRGLLPVASTLFLLLTAWPVYWGTRSFESMTKMGLQQIQSFSLTGFVGNSLNVSQAQFGETLPIWLTGVRLTWLILIFVVGAILWTKEVGYLRRPSSVRVPSTLLIAYFAFVLVSVAIVILTEGGVANARRSLTYGGFLSVPFLLMLMQRGSLVVRAFLLRGLVLVVVALSLPSFLGIGFNIPRWAYYNVEYSPGAWINSLYGTGKGLDIFADVPVFWAVSLSVTDARFHIERSFLEFEHPEEQAVVWKAFDELLDRYHHSRPDASDALFVYSPKMALYSGSIYGISPNHPGWRAILLRLRESNNQIFDVGPIQVFSRWEGRGG
jgi:hypothetical protein